MGSAARSLGRVGRLLGTDDVLEGSNRDSVPLEGHRAGSFDQVRLASSACWREGKVQLPVRRNEVQGFYAPQKSRIASEGESGRDIRCADARLHFPQRGGEPFVVVAVTRRADVRVEGGLRTSRGGSRPVLLSERSGRRSSRGKR